MLAGVYGVLKEAHLTQEAARKSMRKNIKCVVLTACSKAMDSMSSLDVEITMDCLVVEIERPWLHAELFTDAELDSGK